MSPGRSSGSTEAPTTSGGGCSPSVTVEASTRSADGYDAAASLSGPQICCGADVEHDRDTALDRAIAMVATLPDNLAEAVMLRVVNDLPIADVAAVMGVSEGNVRVLVHRGAGTPTPEALCNGRAARGDQQGVMSDFDELDGLLGRLRQPATPAELASETRWSTSWRQPIATQRGPPCSVHDAPALPRSSPPASSDSAASPLPARHCSPGLGHHRRRHHDNREDRSGSRSRCGRRGGDHHNGHHGGRGRDHNHDLRGGREHARGPRRGDRGRG